MFNDRIVDLAAEAGKVMLQNGGETYRVEQTIGMICRAYNVKDVESFVSPTAIITSTVDANGKSHTIIKRILTRSIDLEKIALVNDLSRKLQKNTLEPEELADKIEIIKQSKVYGRKIKCFMSGINAATFTMLFGGGIYDFFIAFLAGIIINIVITIFGKLNVNAFFTNIAGGTIAGLIALTAASINPRIFHSDLIIIGSIMLLVPGLIITNAIRDTIAGDLISGLSRGIEATVVAGAIAIGTAFSIKLWMFFT